jgi:hypothetical protein
MVNCLANHPIVHDGVHCGDRCTARSTPPVVCCDICHPSAFQSIPPAGVPVPKRKAPKNKVLTQVPDTIDRALKAALVQWRERFFEDIYGAEEDYWGPEIVLSDALVERIVGLARMAKLRDFTALCTQISWCYMAQHGEVLLKIVHAHRPLAQVPSTPLSTGPLQPRSVNATPESQKSTRTCSACAQPGHISECVAILNTYCVN